MMDNWGNFVKLFFDKLDKYKGLQEPLSGVRITAPYNEIRPTIRMFNNQTIDGTGVKTVFTIPENEQWDIYQIVTLRGSGTFEFSKISAYEVIGKPLQDWEGGDAANQRFMTGQTPYRMFPGQTVRVSITAHSVNGNLATKLYAKITTVGKIEEIEQ